MSGLKKKFGVLAGQKTDSGDQTQVQSQMCGVTLG